VRGGRTRDARAARVARVTLAGLLAAATALVSAAPAPAGPASSASGPAPSKPLAAFAEASDAACRQLVVPPLLARPDFAPVLAARPIAVDDVCRCVREAVAGDVRLAPAFQGDAATVDARMRTADVMSYLSMRVVSAALSCTAREMDRSLAVAPLPAVP
jgi:hypothetical protein